jgi:15-cis-phytoene synthase
MNESRQIVRTAARAFERDRYLASLLSPVVVRDDLLVLAAFAAELGRIAPMVSEPMIGLIRLQWWRDTLRNGGPSGHPIADALLGVCERHKLAPDAFAAVVDGHEQDFASDPPADDTALLAHIDAIQGSLFRLAVQIVAPQSAAAAAPMALHAARAYGIARILLELPALHAQGRTLLPQSRLADLGTSAAKLVAGEAKEQLLHMTRDIAALARAELSQVRGELVTAGSLAWPALLPVALVEPYLGFVERRAALHAPTRDDIAPLQRVWALWRSSRRRKP